MPSFENPCGAVTRLQQNLVDRQGADRNVGYGTMYFEATFRAFGMQMFALSPTMEIALTGLDVID
jgi:hypothetical protein